jgi:hypothetical protein
MRIVETFNTTGSFTIPAGVSDVLVEVFGGGAGGANVAGQAAGGGGGAYAQSNLGNISGQTVFFNVGQGGTSGNAGGNTWARVGTNAAPTTTAQGALAAGGSVSAGGTVAASIGSIAFAGGDGAAAQAGGGARAGSGGGGSGGSGGGGSNGTAGSGGTTVGVGGNGGTPDGGRGGDGGASGDTGQNGSSPGGGGGGSGSSFTGSGSGANGLVRISWVVISNAVFSLSKFQYYNDNGSETSSIALGGENTNIKTRPYKSFRLRFGIEQTLVSATDGLVRNLKIQYSVNNGTFIDLLTQGATSGPVRFSTGAISNNTATTSRLTGLGGTFVAGLIKNENASIQITFLPSQLSYTELEFLVEIYGGIFLPTDTIRFRVVNSDGNVLDTVLVTPELARSPRKFLLG